ncbi:MAG: ribosome assembly factor SBDS [Candidatus Aenigmarchaeota archaeon]
MVSLEKAVIARISKDGKTFEILVDSEKALEFRKGRDYSMENIMAVRDIFSDSKKGERASPSDIEAAFGTSDPFQAAAQILKNGQLQLTTEQRRKLTEEKRKQIADIISRQGVNPQTKLPHPPNRIMNAMDQAHFQVDPMKPPQEQVQAALEKIEPILPIKFERVEIAVRIPLDCAGKANSFVRGIAPVKKEEWKSDSWIVVLEIPAGMQTEVMEKLNGITGGRAEVKILRHIDI